MIFLPMERNRLAVGVYLVGCSNSSKRSTTAADCRSPHVTSLAVGSGYSVSTTDEDVTVRSVCGACRSNAATAVPQ